MSKNDQLSVWLIALLAVLIMLVRLSRQEPFNHTDLIITLVITFILFGHRLPRLMLYLGRWPD